MKKILKQLTNETWKKCLLIFIIIFILTFVFAGGMVDYLYHTIDDKNIHQDMIIIKDKANNNTDYYTVVDSNDKVYSIANEDSKMFEDIQIGNKYKVIVKEPINDNQTVYILQVHNETS